MAKCLRSEEAMNRRQTIPKHLRYTINDFNRQFPDDDACLEHLKEQRFPKGVASPGVRPMPVIIAAA